MNEKVRILIEDLAALFGDTTSMEYMDAADFVDNAPKIWDLRERAKEINKTIDIQEEDFIIQRLKSFYAIED